MDYSKKSYDVLWKKVIKPQIEAFSVYVVANKLQFVVLDEKETQKRIWDEYEIFRNMCKGHYMVQSKSEHVIDRHKVCACIMYAIIKASPFINNGNEFDEDEYFDTPNEQLAITVGLSLLRGYIINATEDFEGKKKSKKQINQDRRIFEKGFVFPNDSDVGHGTYRNNFAVELYYTKKENSYNILSLSNTLYLLELYNRKIWSLSNS